MCVHHESGNTNGIVIDNFRAGVAATAPRRRRDASPSPHHDVAATARAVG